MFLQDILPVCIIEAFIDCHISENDDTFSGRVHVRLNNLEKYVKE